MTIKITDICQDRCRKIRLKYENARYANIVNMEPTFFVIAQNSMLILDILKNDRNVLIFAIYDKPRISHLDKPPSLLPPLLLQLMKF